MRSARLNRTNKTYGTYKTYRSQNTNATGVVMQLKGKTVAVLVEQQYQELEVWYPYYRLKEAGATVLMVGPEAGKTYPSKLGYPAKSDKAAKDVSAASLDGIVIPGGFAPDYFRRDPATIQL